MRKKLLILARGGLSFCSNRKLAPTCRPKWVSIELSNSVGLSNIQWRGWSYAASVRSDMLNAQKGRKRVPKHERRAMVESFVNKYRAMNAGKFPTITDTMKQVGGSHYVIREIIQELKYKSKMNSSNSMDENLVEKGLTTEAVMVSSGNTETAKDRSIQDDSHSVVLDDTRTGNAGYEHLEEKRGPQTSSWERKLSKEVVITSSPENHCIASENNLLEKCSEEPYQLSLQMLNDVKTEEAESTCSDSVSAVSHLLKEDRKHVSAPLSEKSSASYDKAQSHESEFVDMENHTIMEEKHIEKEGYEGREQAALEELSEEPYHSSLQMPNDVKTEEAASSYSSDSVARERHPLKEEIEHVSAPFIEISGSSHIKAQSHESEVVDMENHLITEEKCIEKTGYERREQAALEGLSEEPSHLSLQMPNDVKTEGAVSSYSSDSVAPERHLLKEEIEHVSAPFIEKSGSSRGKAQSHDSEFVDMENHPIIEKKSFEKAGYEGRKQNSLEDLPGVDGPKHKMEPCQGSLELDESKTDKPNDRETSPAVVSKKSTLWGNLKSFADGIINIWRKL